MPVLPVSTWPRRRRRSSARSTATRFPPTARRCSSRKGGKYRHHRPAQRVRSTIDKPLNLSRHEGAARSPGGVEADLPRIAGGRCATSSTTPACTASTGRRRAKYEPLVAHVNHRADLTYIIGEMIGELNAGHAYVGGGDLPKVAQIQTGPARRPSCAGRNDEGYYQIAKILKGHRAGTRSCGSPLAELGVDVKDGDYIIAVNGQPTNEMVNIYRGAGQHGRQAGPAARSTTTPAEKGSREMTVVPIADEHPLYYHDWVRGQHQEGQRRHQGQGRLPARARHAAAGLNEFAKHYLPADPQEGADHRRARQRRRQRLADAHRAAPARDRHDRPLPATRIPRPTRATSSTGRWSAC